MSQERHELRVDLTGKRFGRLLALRDAGGPLKRRSRPWVCQCDCGRTVILPAVELQAGGHKSCGCLWRENQKARRLKGARRGGRGTGPAERLREALAREAARSAQ